MCGRIALYSEPDRIARILDAQLALDRDDWQQSWNVAPTDTLVGVSGHADRSRTLRAYRWGLVPIWAKDPSAMKTTFNARAESVASKATFSTAFKRGRILVPVDAFYEWRTDGKVKTPNLFTRADGEPIVFAGLRERWEGGDGSLMHSATIITTEAGPDMEGVHNRMPVVLERDAWENWLDPAVDDRGELESLLRPAAAGTLVHHEVGRGVGNVRNDGPELIGAVNSL
jgi:putative SOS response-associated peptidase YedK